MHVHLLIIIKVETIVPSIVTSFFDLKNKKSKKNETKTSKFKNIGVSLITILLYFIYVLLIIM